MNALYAVELRRLITRRLTRGIAAFLLLGIVTAGIVAFAVSDRDIEGATRRARAAAAAEYEACVRAVVPAEAPAEKCEPAADSSVDPRFHLSSYVEVARNLAALAGILAFIVGASFVGADWHSRVITTTLTWEPRRARLLLAKLGAVAAVCGVGTFVALTVLGVALVPAAAFRGTTQGAGAAWLADLAGVLGRVSLFGAIASVAGASLAMIGRNTTAAVGAAFVWLSVIEGLIRGLRPSWRGLLLGENAGVMLGVPGVGLDRPAVVGGLVVLVYTAALAAAASAAFKRDVA